ncbi:uncharacterized protein LOC125945554 [Dermacentor silvarum]|uniref:uncharacterized protein LOC125945554 n=1 Tax=Dermacentor silvarum TaxID=543639 RepID=UPI002100E50D|nr:uncharacterized protein LOC125945554 [Dermacentor silvarum]
MRYLRYNLKYSEALDAMYTYDNSLFVMFMYDDEEGLCRKVCNIKSKHEALEFGLAVYDLDYEDYYNNCSARNLFGAFSRLKMVRRLSTTFGLRRVVATAQTTFPAPSDVDDADLRHSVGLTST